MVIEYVRYTIPAEQADPFIAAYATAGEALRKVQPLSRLRVGNLEEMRHYERTAVVGNPEMRSQLRAFNFSARSRHVNKK